LEREIKLSIQSPERVSGAQIAAYVRDILRDSVFGAGKFETPDILGKEFYLTGGGVPFFFRDIYLDTKDGINLKHNIAFRLRHRWKNGEAFRSFFVMRDPSPDYFPIRCEIQAKVGREELGDGFSVSHEVRLEFSKKDADVLSSNRAPPPWPAKEYIRYAQSGRFHGQVIMPVLYYAKTLREIGFSRDRVYLRPQVALYTKRWRFHYNMKTPWGSGPNPTQAFIITLDRFQGKKVDEFEFYGPDHQAVDKRFPEFSPVRFELEIEFERNVSTQLDRAINAASASRNMHKSASLKAKRSAFLRDQRTLGELLIRGFQKRGFYLKPMNQSKYKQIAGILADTPLVSGE